MKLLTTMVMSLSLLASTCVYANQTGAAPGSDASSVASREGSQTITIIRSGSQPSGKGPAEYFTGTVRTGPLFNPPAPARARR